MGSARFIPNKRPYPLLSLLVVVVVVGRRVSQQLQHKQDESGGIYLIEAKPKQQGTTLTWWQMLGLVATYSDIKFHKLLLPSLLLKALLS